MLARAAFFFRLPQRHGTSRSPLAPYGTARGSNHSGTCLDIGFRACFHDPHSHCLGRRRRGTSPHRPAGDVRKAYDLTNKKNIRNVFRRAAYANPDWWDWIGDAHVPSALSPEMAEAEQRKKGVRRKGLKERMKEREDAKRVEQEREKERLEAAARVTQPPNVRSQNKTRPQRLGGPGAVPGASTATLDSMPPEMRTRIERERRARAAEARLRNLGGGGH